MTLYVVHEGKLYVDSLVTYPEGNVSIDCKITRLENKAFILNAGVAISHALLTTIRDDLRVLALANTLEELTKVPQEVFQRITDFLVKEAGDRKANLTVINSTLLFDFCTLPTPKHSIRLIDGEKLPWSAGCGSETFRTFFNAGYTASTAFEKAATVNEFCGGQLRMYRIRECLEVR